jgi:hypothetical protein
MGVHEKRADGHFMRRRVDFMGIAHDELASANLNHGRGGGCGLIRRGDFLVSRIRRSLAGLVGSLAFAAGE